MQLQTVRLKQYFLACLMTPLIFGVGCRQTLSPPQELRAQIRSSAEVTLVWKPGLVATPDHYLVKRAVTSPTNTFVPVGIVSNGTEFAIKDLATTEPCFYVVSAVNERGESGNS